MSILPTIIGATLLKECQSCGSSFGDRTAGSNADRTKSIEYCKRCYQDGSFTEPDISLEQMIKKVDGKLKAWWIPSFLRRIRLRRIPKLKRWKS